MFKKIEIKNMAQVKQTGIITGHPEEMSDQHMAVVAECIMQVIYNLAVQSNIDINYDMHVGDTKYMIHGTDVAITHPNGEPIKRRIKNDRSLVANHAKEGK